MGGITDVLKAKTKKELREKIRRWRQQVREMGWDERWVHEADKKNEDGEWEAEVSAHS